MKLNKLILLPASTVILLSSLGSCGLYKKYETPTDTALLAEYKQAQEAEIDSMAYGNLRWQDVFTDPVLAGIIDQALTNNVNLRNAKLNIDIAHAQLKGAKLSYFPSVALAPNGSGSKFFTDPSTSMSWGYQIPLSVSWEVDVFGKLLNSKRGAEVAVEQSKDYAQAVRSQIIAGVANCYYAIATLEAQLQVSRSTAEIWKQNVQTMKDLKEAGTVTEVAVVQSEAQYYGILGSITDLEVSLDEMQNTLSLLVGVMPQKWTVSPEAIFTAPSIIRSSVPMYELAMRPDVAAAERAMAVAYYSTNSARAAFYPGLNITANGGFTNLLGSMVVNPGKFFINLAGSLTAPIFSRGQNIARLEAAKAQQEQAMNTFEYTLMSAAAEVSDAMTLYEKSVEKQLYLEKQAEQLTLACDYTQELLKLGSYNTTYLDVLTAQQSLLSAQISAITARNSETRALINLYQALGGGR
ncbi:MAG: TolC family protein [Bacteroides sp.]|nr:TolC family protein [Bacteroides sp.]MCM1413922.1 TolC family protein [Bacteroides sp.]MCM1471651.1 TolC family protein [Bacteroides sp.]